MSIFRRHVTHIVVPLLIVMSVGEKAHGFDSYGADINTPHTHNRPMPIAPWPIGRGFFGQLRGVRPSGAVYDALTVPDQKLYADNFRAFEAPNDPIFTPDGPKYYVYTNQGNWDVDDPNSADPKFTPAVSGIYVCAQSAMTSVGVNLNACHVPDKSEAIASGPNDAPEGWLRVRKNWSESATGNALNLGHGAEHMQMLLRAVDYAGLSATPLFTHRFWLRYPVRDAYVASHIGSDGDYAVAQTWNPTAPSDGYAHAVRAVYLPELAQMPDVSSSVSDWASGNEVCPDSTLQAMRTNGAQIFGSAVAEVNACHSFTKVLGTLNSSHFAPLAQQFYTHYHALAIGRMTECSRLANALNRPFQNVFPTSSWDRQTWLEPIPYDSESQECEREALVYEMFAQHYLQDAWASGHMWYRWGYPTLAAFPDRLGPAPSYEKRASGVDDVVVAPENTAARRFVIAAVTAGYAGMIHGTKGFLGDLVPQVVASIGAKSWPNFLDDPLCGPDYWSREDQRDYPTSWMASNGRGPFPGVGDLFWNYATKSRYVSLEYEEKYAEQRAQLLACSARSLRDVYVAGPQAHGAIGVATSIPKSGGAAIDPAAVNIASDCFGQLATNTSMLGSLGPIYARRKWTEKSLGLSWITTQANKLLIDGRLKTVTFADDDDRKRFETALRQRVSADNNQLNLALSIHALRRANGTEAARLLLRPDDGSGESEKITFLGVPPNSSVAAEPPTPYTDASDVALGTTSEAVRRVFWRSHVRETCSIVDDISVLRDRCLQAASFGGDPDACTACVDLAELHAPPCGYDGVLGTSKCAALGAEGTTSSFPPAWYDASSCHCNPQMGSTDPHSDPACGRRGRDKAVWYCTGTGSSPADGYGVSFLGSQNFEDGSHTSTWRVAVASDWINGDMTGYMADTDRHRLRPLVTAFEETLDVDHVFTPLDGGYIYNRRSRSSRDPILQQMYPGLPLYSDKEHGFLALMNQWEDASVPTCGVTQRMMFWNDSCDRVFASYPGAFNVERNQIVLPTTGAVVDTDDGVPISSTGQLFETHTGPSILTSFDHPSGLDLEVNGQPERRCSIKEMRRFTPTCPGNGMCNSGGACVWGRSSLPGFTVLQ